MDIIGHVLNNEMKEYKVSRQQGVKVKVTGMERVALNSAGL